MVAGSIRRKVEDTKPLSYLDLAKRLESIEDDARAQRLIAILYLSGRRANEVLELRKEDLKVDGNRVSFETFNEKVYRKNRTGNFQIPREGKYSFYDRETKKTIDYDLAYYERIRPHWRLDTLSGRALTKYLTNTLGSLSPKDYLFPRLKGSGHIHYQMLYKIIRFYLPDAWPHILRHERFTEVVRAYANDPVASHRFTFHKRFESTLQYVREQEEEKI